MKFTRMSLILTLGVLVTACSMTPTRTGSSSSLVDYLYPNGEIPPAAPDRVPEIQLPTSVGLAFVPGSGSHRLGEAKMNELLNIVREAFLDREFIARIEIIPSNYLQAKGGFEGLEAVGRLYKVDQIALVSYDQVLHSADQASSLLYWTIVGAYVIKGTSNDVTTFVDTAVFDLATHSLLFRAPGIDERSARSTGIDVLEVSREVSEDSFSAAMEQMTVNLDSELERFSERVKNDSSVRITHRNKGDGASGAGHVDAVLIGLLLLGAAAANRSRRV